MIKYLLYYVIFSLFAFLLFLAIVIIDGYVTKKPDSKFAKWFRKNICKPDPNDF